jgi:TetR/AcrR family transcriptional repressor of nem operon
MARPKSFDEATVLDRAMELFWQRGYEATSISDLEAHLGLGRQSLYNTFGDKHDLFLKALERYAGESAQRPIRHLMAPGAGLDGIRACFDELIATSTAPGPRRACMVANTILELGAADGEALARCDGSRRAVHEGFRLALANAVRQGELPADYDVEAGALMMVTQMYGLAVMSKAGATAKELRAAVAALLPRG